MPSADEAVRIQQSKIRQLISFDGSALDTPDARAETLIQEQFKRITNYYPYTYEYDDKGIVKENDLIYKRTTNQIFLSNRDTLFLNQQGAVSRTSVRKSIYTPGGYQYKYDAGGNLIEEFIPNRYIPELSYKINCRHEYINGNRVRSVLYRTFILGKEAVDSVVVSYDYSSKLINSGLPYVEFDVLGVEYGGLLSRLDKYHASLYGKFNLPVRGVHFKTTRQKLT